LTLVSDTSAPPFQPLRHQRNFCHSFVKLYATNTSQRKQKTFLYEYPLQYVLLPKKKRTTTLLLGSTLIKHGRHFDYWNQPVSMRMVVCYLDCHDAWLCCYLVIHIETLLHPSQLFYFHLWLSLIYPFVSPVSVFSLPIGNACMNMNLSWILLSSVL
jgi:hypothetical protein